MTGDPKDATHVLTVRDGQFSSEWKFYIFATGEEDAERKKQELKSRGVDVIVSVITSQSVRVYDPR
jgi:hypothetical protein